MKISLLTCTEFPLYLFIDGGLIIWSLLIGIAIFAVVVAIYFYRQVEVQKKFNTLLKQRMVEQMKRLNQSNRELMTTNEEMQQFNFIISHDLKEPLRNIVSFSSLALMQSTDPRIKEYLVYVHKSGKQLNTLIDDIKDFRELNEFKNVEDEVNLNELVDQIRQEFSGLIEEKNARIKYPMLPTIIANRNPLYVIFKNLLENGLKYNQQERPLVSINYQQHQDYHIFFFEDNGIGIEKQYFDKVFTLFKRLNSRKDYDGSGVGMPVSKKLAKKMNGDLIIFESIIGQGSIFQLTIPKMGRDLLIKNEALEVSLN